MIPLPQKLNLQSWGEPENPELWFFHANSYSARMYASFLEPLMERMHILAPDLPGHGTSLWDGRIRNWYELADWYLERMPVPDPDSPITVMGHSIGGILAMIMAVRKPTWFSKIILMDPVLLPKRFLLPIGVMRFLGFQHHFPLARKAYRRRRFYPNREAALERYRRKRVFAHWQSGFLEAYVDTCLRELADGSLELCCSPDLEASVYETLPLSAWKLPRRIRVPTLILVGDRSDTISPRGVERLRSMKGNLVVRIVPGGHLFPFEEPRSSMTEIEHFLNEQT